MRDKTSERTPKTILLRLLLLSAALILAIGVCEVLLRLASEEPIELSLIRGDDFQALYFEPDPVIGIVRRPNLDLRFRFEDRPSGFIHFQTNNLGLRRSEPTHPGRFRGKRVLVLGDSQIDGSVDNRENVCTVLEEGLNHGSDRWEVLNAATGSYSPYQSYLWYRTRGSDLSPNVILFTVFLGNDLAELVAPGRPRLSQEDGVFRELPATADYERRMQANRIPSLWTRLRFFLLQNSVLFGRLTSLAGGGGVQAAGAMSEAYHTCIGCTGQSLGQIYWFKHHPEDIQRSLSTLDELLRRFETEANRAGSRLVVLILPTRLQVEPEQDSARIRKTARLLDLAPDDLRLENRLETETLRVARERNIEAVDLTPLLTQHHLETGKNLYYHTDWHLDAEGHRFLAEELQRRIFD